MTEPLSELELKVISAKVYALSLLYDRALAEDNDDMLYALVEEAKRIRNLSVDEFIAEVKGFESN